MSDYHGHMTLADGRHVPLSKAESATLWEAAEARAARDAELMPTTIDVLDMRSGVEQRLRKLGWAPGRYCDKSGAEFAVITDECTGIFRGWHDGVWPRGSIWVMGDEYSYWQCLWKPLDKLTDAEREKMDRDIQFNEECEIGHAVRIARLAETES